MSSVKSAVNLLLYSVAFGGGIMHSYIVSPIAFKHMPIDQFGNLQNKVFPIYFIGQAAAPILLGLTTPLTLLVAGPLLAASSIAGALNYFWVLPVCKSVKSEKIKLIAANLDTEDVDGVSTPTPEFTALSKKFGTYHGISSLLNLVSLLTLAIYGILLAKKF